MRRARSLLASCLALVLAAPAALAEVLVVAPSGAHFTQISDAVAAARPGDIVLVESGQYGFVAIVNKDISIIADTGASVTVSGMSIEQLQSSKAVVLHGLTLGPTAPPLVHGFRVYVCTGAVRVENCSFVGSHAELGDFPPQCALVHSSSQVSFAHCSFVGSEGTPAGDGPLGMIGALSGGAGLETYASGISLWQCSLTGGKNADGQSPSPTTGGDGGSFLLGTTVLDGCTLTGGAGGEGASGPVGGQGSPGGDGMYLDGGMVRHTDTDFVPGAGGAGGTSLAGPPGPAGAPGNAQTVFLGTVVPYQAAARDLTVNSPVRGGETASFQLGVVSCDTVFLLVSTRTQYFWLGGPQGTLITGLPVHALSLALPCATGTQSFSTPIPQLPAGIAGANLYVQALHGNSTDGLQLGPPVVLTLLDSSIP